MIHNPNNFISWTQSTGLPLLVSGWTIASYVKFITMSFVFCELIFISLAFDHESNSSNAHCKEHWDCTLQISYTVLSSTYLTMENSSFRSDSMMVNKRGPSLVPCGTPPWTLERMSARRWIDQVNPLLSLTSKRSYPTDIVNTEPDIIIDVISIIIYIIIIIIVILVHVSSSSFQKNYSVPYFDNSSNNIVLMCIHIVWWKWILCSEFHPVWTASTERKQARGMHVLLFFRCLKVTI